VFDPGAMHNPSGTREADVVLAYGLELKGVLEARGMEVFMTRDNNTSPTPVGRRASRAKTAGCDIFVSIHLNSADSSSANGPRSRITISERVFAQSGSHTVMPTNAQHGRFSLISSRQWITL